MRKNLIAKDEEIDSLGKNAATLMADLAHLSSEFESAISEHMIATKMHDGTQDEMLKEIEELKARLSQERSENVSLKAKLEQYQGEIKSMALEIEELKDSLKKEKELRGKNEKEVNASVQRMAAKNKEQAEWVGTKIGELEAQLAESKSKTEIVDLELTATKDAMKVERVGRLEAVGALKMASEELEAANEELKVDKVKMKEMEEALSKCEREMEMMEAQLKAEVKEALTAKREMEIMEDQLRQEIETALTAKMEQEEARADVARKREMLSSDLEMLKKSQVLHETVMEEKLMAASERAEKAEAGRQK